MRIGGIPLELVSLGLTASAVAFIILAFLVWMRDRRRQLAVEEERLKIERMRVEEPARHGVVKIGDAAGGSPRSGGYIVIEMSERERPLFHDLLKGFEEFAKLKGYEIAFSIDSSADGRIGFKFTMRDDGNQVAADRVRQDFRQYLKEIVSGPIEDLDRLPIVTSLEEHALVVTLLKNRLTFLQHSYKVLKVTAAHFEKLLLSPRHPALGPPQVIVQTGGNMDSKNYSATNSSRFVQGEGNEYEDSSVNIDIGQSFNQKQERIAALDDLIAKLKTSGVHGEPVQKAERALATVRDEVADHAEPDKSTVKKLMENSKNLLATAALSYEVTEAAKKLFELFGVQ
jgi:hypothetical protein